MSLIDKVFESSDKVRWGNIEGDFAIIKRCDPSFTSEISDIYTSSIFVSNYCHG